VERAEYERMHELEDRMWWYRGLRALARKLLAAHSLAPARPGRYSTQAAGPAACWRRWPRGPGLSHIRARIRRACGRARRVKSGRPVAAGSVNEMPLGDGTLGHICRWTSFAMAVSSRRVP